MKDMYKSGANNMAKQILDAVERAKGDRILIFPHKSVDGDCIGSSTAMASILRKLGVDAFVAIQEKRPDNMDFMDIDEFLLPLSEAAVSSVAMAIDCSEGSRMGIRGDEFSKIEDILIIDHHESVKLEGERYYIVPSASSACELVFYVASEIADLLNKPLEEIIDKRAAVGLLTGLVTDTGRFSYKNTHPETLTVAGQLLELGGNIEATNYNLYDRKRRTEFLTSNAACIESEFYFDGKFALCRIDDSLFARYGGDREDVSDVVSRLRDVEGVELAIVLRVLEDGSVRGNLRSKNYFDCATFASSYDGGGHYHAAGLNVYDKTIDEVAEEIISKVGEML